jgi:hypothetical protein
MGDRGKEEKGGKEEEEYFILRLPDAAAAELHTAITQKKVKDRLKINM